MNRFMRVVTILIAIIIVAMISQFVWMDINANANDNTYSVEVGYVMEQPEKTTVTTYVTQEFYLETSTGAYATIQTVPREVTFIGDEHRKRADGFIEQITSARSYEEYNGIVNYWTRVSFDYPHDYTVTSVDIFDNCDGTSTVTLTYQHDIEQVVSCSKKDDICDENGNHLYFTYEKLDDDDLKTIAYWEEPDLIVYSDNAATYTLVFYRSDEECYDVNKEFLEGRDLATELIGMTSGQVEEYLLKDGNNYNIDEPGY